MSHRPLVKAVVLARGLGSRMREQDASARLDTLQTAAANAGQKAMIPFERPFLDYVLSGLADAGLAEICLVLGPEHAAIRHRYTGEAAPQRFRVRFALQQEPLGTADAVLCAEEFAGGDPFLVLNADNYYPVSAYAALLVLHGAGLPVFRRSTLVARGNIPAERVDHYAVASVDGNGHLRRLFEKPDADTLASCGSDPWISMNLWRFSPAIFQACRDVGPSTRGELELPRAVDYAVVALGQKFRAVPCEEGVLDLSRRADIAPVGEKLRGISVRL